jgi:predicted permease
VNPIVVEVLASVAKTFAVMAIGVGFRRFWSRDITALNDLAMHLFVPCLAFNAILRLELSAQEFSGLAAAAVLIQLGMLGLALAAFRLTGTRSRGLLLAVIYANCANLPFPILEANYGAAGLGYGVIYFLVNHLSLFSVGILFLSRTLDVRALLKLPVFIFSVAAIVLLALDRRPPAVVLDTAELLGDAAIPLILFTFGYSLAGVRTSMWRQTLLGAVLRLAGGCALGLAVAQLVGLEGLQRDVVILVATMPSAVINVALAERYRADPELVASVVFVTTAAAVVIIPALLIWLRLGTG